MHSSPYFGMMCLRSRKSVNPLVSAFCWIGLVGSEHVPLVSRSEYFPCVLLIPIWLVLDLNNDLSLLILHTIGLYLWSLLRFTLRNWSLNFYCVLDQRSDWLVTFDECVVLIFSNLEQLVSACCPDCIFGLLDLPRLDWAGLKYIEKGRCLGSKAKYGSAVPYLQLCCEGYGGFGRVHPIHRKFHNNFQPMPSKDTRHL